MASTVEVPQQPSDPSTLNDLRLFLAGTSGYESKIKSGDVAKAAIRLLKTLPVAREAVLEYMHNLFDDAVNRHIMRLDSEDTGVPTDLSGEREIAVDEVQAVLSGFIKSNLNAWAPIISTWSLELLGHLTRKYADRRIVHYSSSLPEVLQIWMACPPTRTLMDLTTQCLSTLIDTDPDRCIDALLETSVQHSPHFDWVVAHIGSCFPNTVITRVLACGLKDFISHEEDQDMGGERTRVPKLASVVGILGHLAGQHSADIRRALVALLQDSFSASPTREQLATVPFLLQLASMSELLLTAIVSEFTRVVSADMLNKLSGLVAKWESAKIPGTRDLMNLTVILMVQSGTGDLRFLAQVLDIAAGESDFSKSLLPTVQSAAGILLDSVLLEMQHRVYAGSGDIPLLLALERRLNDVCAWLDTRCGPRTLWLWNVLALMCVHSKEKTCVTVLSHLLCRSTGGPTELLLFQGLVHQVEVVHINSLPHALSHLMAELRSGRVPDPARLVRNLQTLAASPQSGPRVSTAVCQSAEVLAEQMRLTSAPEYADLLAELLSTSVRPEAMSPTAVVKVASSAVAYFFSVVCRPEWYNGGRKFQAACVCMRLLSTLCVRPAAQQLALRDLLRGSLNEEVSWRFGSSPRKREVRRITPFVALLEENQKFATSINFPQSPSSIVRVGVIGSGLRSVVPPPAIAAEEVVLNKQLLLETLTACCALPWVNDQPAPVPRTSPVAGMKIVALLLVEMVSSDVMFNGLPWPDEDFLKVTMERDLHIQAMFVEHPVLWDLLHLVASVRPSLCYCSVLLRAVMAVAMTHWRNCQEKAAANSPKHLETTRRVLRIMSEGQLLPPPMTSTSEILELLTPFEVFCLLQDIWQYMRDNVPSPALFAPQKNGAAGGGQLWREFKPDNGDRKYLERLRMIMISNIETCGPVFQKFFSID
ncbi:unnamed protein product [Ixodes persulcatus]